MNTSFDNLRQQWQSLNRISAPVPTLTPETLSSIAPSTSRLRRFYTVICVIAAIMIVLQPCLLHDYAPPLLGYATSGFFLLCLLTNIYQLILIDRIEISDNTTVDALRHVIRFEQAFNISQRVLFFIAVPLVTAMLYYFSNFDYFMLVGGFLGLIVGTLIGWRNDRNIRRHIRRLKQILESA